MKFTKFRIVNFKGIEDVTINLDKSPNANIYTLVGLNESGKTTILEAINFFNPTISPLEIPGSTITDYNNLIPISNRDNFNGTISIIVTLKLEPDDLAKINSFVIENTDFKHVKPIEEITHYHYYEFENSRYKKNTPKWTGFEGCLKESTSDDEYCRISQHKMDDNYKLSTFCTSLIPSILYFPNFLFDFPSRIYLESTEVLTGKETFYLELIQDILFSLQNDTNYKTHIIERIKSKDSNDKRNLDSLLKKMNKKVSDVVFDAWNTIFKREVKDAQVIIKCDVDERDKAYLEFGIEASDGIYQINERSLGFRWFFTFLLFTQFRPYRKESPQNVIFLFDEPASNLHSSAQTQLLKSFENLMKNCKIIYTTHSHYLINPHWLESTYVVKNEGLILETPENYNAKKTKINIEPFREFVLKHPHNKAYFQPILDVLDYSPSNLESLPDCVLMEGKNDYYTISYFQNVILKKPTKLNIAPSTGSSNLDTLISLYIGWGKEFIILLDSDKEGKTQKDRYIEKFGIIVERRIFTLEDIDPTWGKLKMEKLFDSEESLEFQKTAYPDSKVLNKTHFNRTIQENLINNIEFEFSEQTIANFALFWTFLDNKLKEQKLDS